MSNLGYVSRIERVESHESVLDTKKLNTKNEIAEYLNSSSDNFIHELCTGVKLLPSEGSLRDLSDILPMYDNELYRIHEECIYRSQQFYSCLSEIIKSSKRNRNRSYHKDFHYITNMHGQALINGLQKLKMRYYEIKQNEEYNLHIALHKVDTFGRMVYITKLARKSYLNIILFLKYYFHTTLAFGASALITYLFTQNSCYTERIIHICNILLLAFLVFVTLIPIKFNKNKYNIDYRYNIFHKYNKRS
jgi:hypothetical protein